MHRGTDMNATYSRKTGARKNCNRLRQILLGCALVCVATFAKVATATDAAPNRASTIYRLSDKEIAALLARHSPSTLDATLKPIDEVVIERQVEELPFHSSTEDIWPGLGALLWAATEPTQAWRIFLPVPSN